MDVRGEDGKTDHASKAIGPIRTNPAQPPMLQIIEASCNARMLLAPIGKVRLLLPSAFNLREIPVLRQRIDRQKVIQPAAIGGAYGNRGQSEPQLGSGTMPVSVQ